MKKPTKADDRPVAGADSDGQAISVVEESLRISRQVVETGSVRIKKVVDQEEIIVSDDATTEELDIKRVAINKRVELAPPPIRYEGDTMIVSVLREEIVTEKRIILAEELHIKKKVAHQSFEKPVVLRKERIVVTRTGQDGREVPMEEKNNTE